MLRARRYGVGGGRHVRVIAGEKGGRRLGTPAGLATRPTSDRVREAAFSMLESHGLLSGAAVWDLFAGSGALGIEALSRGAARATFVDSAKPATAVVRANLAKLGYGPDRATVVCAEVLKWVHGLDGGPSPDGTGPSLVLADPPYMWRSWSALLEALTPLGPALLMETDEEPDLPDGWRVVKLKRYGSTLITLARPSDESGGK
jgi:16S rRNA (guanine966-N2)-methyltransferase